MMLCVALLTFVSLAPPQQARQPFEQKIPESLVSFKMIPLPDGEITLGNKKFEIKNLYIEESETPWDVFDIYAFKLDVPQDEQLSPNTVRSRPSKPYGNPDWGFGHAGSPCLSMTFHSAQSFCKWLSDKTGKKYRLPTEAEWEYAARAGQIKASEPIDEHAWFEANSDKKTHPIKTKKPNVWGLFDMLGNAGEWCEDKLGDPVLCGGTYQTAKKNLSPSTRDYQERSWNKTDPQMPKSKWWLSDGFFVGFRVVCEGN